MEKWYTTSITTHTHSDGSHYPKEACPVYKTVRDGKQREVDDEVFWRKDGSKFPVEYIATAIQLDDEIVGAVIVFKDISERKRSESELKAALSQVEKLKDNSPVNYIDTHLYSSF